MRVSFGKLLEAPTGSNKPTGFAWGGVGIAGDHGIRWGMKVKGSRQQAEEEGSAEKVKSFGRQRSRGIDRLGKGRDTAVLPIERCPKAGVVGCGSRSVNAWLTAW